MSKLLKDLGAALLLSEHELMKLIRSAPRRYKVYTIPKRKPGQFRTIAQPAKEVKALQYWVIDHILNKFPIHSAARAYRTGKSILDNARPHRNGKYLLKLDFTDFFPSLTARDFVRYLKNGDLDLEKLDVEALSRILFWKPKEGNKLSLSIGAPSSPILSNILLYQFDEKVAAFCSKHRVIYTRYADDLSFSAKVSPALGEVEQYVVKLCQRVTSPKLTLNSDKLVRVSKRDARRITGLVVSNDAQISLGREMKRNIRATVHHFINKSLDEAESRKLKGMLAYVKSVEPTFLARLEKKYGTEIIRRIQIFS